MDRVQVLKNNLPKIHGILWGQCASGFQNEVQGDPYYDTNSNSFDWLWLMEKIKLNLSGIKHTSNPFHADFCALKGVFNLNQVQTDSLDYF